MSACKRIHCPWLQAFSLIFLFCCSAKLAAAPSIAATGPRPVPFAARADRVVVHKAERLLTLMRGDTQLASYAIALGPKPRGHKMREGDERTPEGRYWLDYKKADSDFYKSIRISYPNSQDRERSRAAGVNPGGMIMIHGQPNNSELPASYVQMFNWTDGCIAVSNTDMDQIWLSVEAGTPIDIYP